MSENENSEKKQRINNPLNKQGGNQKNPNGKKKPTDWVMYIVYAVIILTLGGVWLGGGSKSANREIGWQKLDEILRKGDQREIIVVDKEYAEIYTGLDISAFIKSFDKNHPTGTCNPQN